MDSNKDCDGEGETSAEVAEVQPLQSGNGVSNGATIVPVRKKRFTPRFEMDEETQNWRRTSPSPSPSPSPSNPFKKKLVFTVPGIMRPKQPRENKLRAFVVFMFFVIILMMSLTYVYHQQHLLKLMQLTVDERIKFTDNHRRLQLSNALKQDVLTGRLDKMMSFKSFFLVFSTLVAIIYGLPNPKPITSSLNDGKTTIKLADKLTLEFLNSDGTVSEMKFTNPLPKYGRPKWSATKDAFHALWSNGLQLKIAEANTNSVVRGLNVKWTAPVGEAYTQCVDLGTVNWFGGSELYVQAWPIQTQSFTETAFLPNSQTGGVLERYFLSSGGFAVYVPHSVPLFVSLSTDDNTLCFKASYETPFRNTDGRPTELDYFVFNADAPGLILNHLQVLYTYLGTPPSIPSTKVISSPIWSTWAQYHAAIDQATVLDFAQQIYDNGFSASQIEIDDNWEDCYGNEVFDSTKFPDPAGMVSAIKALGFDVTLWVHPFVNTNCATYAEGDSNKYFVTSNGYDTTGTANWWDGQGGIIDVTKPAANDWWFQRLDKLRTDVGITSFKFDAGETEFLPDNAYLNSSENLQPGIYSTAYAQFISQFGDQLELRVGYGSQTVPNFVRILDRDSRWGLDNGLHSVITSTLHFGISGYPFVLPDYIGGNAYGGEYPDKELYIRWVELSTFLPVMQFSIPPWAYDDEVVQITKKFLDLRTTIVDSLINAANLAVADGYPIIRPLWWVDTTDVTAQGINDQFMVGDSFLVAPIVEKGAVSRDVYFPIGDWVDMDGQQMYSGPVWARNISVPLDDIAFFRMATC